MPQKVKPSVRASNPKKADILGLHRNDGGSVYIRKDECIALYGEQLSGSGKPQTMVYATNGLTGANTLVEASADDILAELSSPGGDWMPFTNDIGTCYVKKELVMFLVQAQGVTNIYSKGLLVFNAKEKADELYTRLIS